MEKQIKERQVRFAMSFLPRGESLRTFYEANEYGKSDNGWEKSDEFFKHLKQKMGYQAFDYQRNVIGHWGSPEPSIITLTQDIQIDIDFVAQSWIKEFDQDAVVCLRPVENGQGGLFFLSFDSLKNDPEKFTIMNSFYKKLAISYNQNIAKNFPDYYLGFSFLLWDRIEYWFEDGRIGAAMYNLMLNVAEAINLKINDSNMILGYEFQIIERTI